MRGGGSLGGREWSSLARGVLQASLVGSVMPLCCRFIMKCSACNMMLHALHFKQSVVGSVHAAVLLTCAPPSPPACAPPPRALQIVVVAAKDVSQGLLLLLRHW